MALWRSTLYTEAAPESPNEKWGPGASSMTRLVYLNDGSFRGRLQAAYDFLGYGVVVGSVGGAYVHRVPPMAYPGLWAGTIKTIDGIPPPDVSSKFYVVAISKTEPWSVPTGVNLMAAPPGTAAADYQRVRMTLECSTLPFAILDDVTLQAQGGVNSAGNPDEGVALALGWQYTRYVTRQRQAFSRLIKVPYGMMQSGAPGFDGGYKLNKTAIPFREGGENRVYTWMRVPLVSPAGPGANFARIEGALGQVNSGWFDGAAPGTLLFDSVATREYQGSFGEWLADVTFNMIYLPHNSSGARFQYGDPAAVTANLKAGTPTGWNTVLDIGTYTSGGVRVTAWDYFPVTTANGTQPPFSYADFSTLFHP
jgi:hypothetical protein